MDDGRFYELCRGIKAQSSASVLNLEEAWGSLEEAERFAKVARLCRLPQP